MAVEQPNDGVEKLSGCLFGGQELVAKPVIFLGGTVLSFNASLGIGPTQESSVTVDIINDCAESGSCSKPEGEYFYGLAKIGAPVWFSVCEAMNNPADGKCFEFGGILQNVTLNQSSGGRTYQARIVDPRSLLANSMLVVGNQLMGPVEHKNYFNVYGHYEHNVLPTGVKYNHAQDGDNKIVLEDSPTTWTVVNPSGDETKVDCSVYGTADSDERGMSYRKVVQALKDMKPLIFSPNYGVDQSASLGQRDTEILADRVKHEENIFEFDPSGLPDPPSYYRVAGPTLSILDLISNVCDVMGYEFHVVLEPKNKANPDAFEMWTIKVVAKKAEIRNIGTSIFEDIAAYDGSAIDISYGKELRLDRNKAVVFGEQKHEMYLSSDIEYYFGEDKYGDPIIPRIDPSNSGCGFLVDIELDELNAQLECPLFDYTGVTLNKPVTRKVTLSEYDLRTALSSVELWKRRVLSSGIPEKAADRAPGKAGDFNRLIRYNFPDLTNAHLATLMKTTSEGKNGNKTHVDGAAAHAFRDMVDFANNKSASAVAHSWTNQMDKIHSYIENIGKTYYGKQFIVTLDVDMCAIEAGIYDENYFSLSPSGLPVGVAYTGTLCGEDITIPDGKIYRPRSYTHTPTNDGAWVDPCFSVLGLTGSGAYVETKNDTFAFYSGVSLDFFKTEDFRVGCFAKFSTREVKITAKAGLISNIVKDGTPAGDLINPSISATWRAPAVCGEINIENFGNDEYLIVRHSGGICLPPVPESDPKRKDTAVIPIETGIIHINEEPITAFVKASVQERVYINANSKVRAVVEFSAPCIKKPCIDQANFSEAVMAVSAALAIGSGILLADDPEGATIALPPATSGAQAIKAICGIPIGSGMILSQGAVDAAGSNSKGFYGSADKPVLIAIPVRNNTQTYGPWYSKNFFGEGADGDGSYGGVSVEQDADFAPWNYGSIGAMDAIAQGVVDEARVGLTELENGTINYPYWPQLPLGFLENGPNLNSMSVVFGGNGITTNYTFQTYTPKFGSLKTLENQALKDSTKNRQRALKIIRDNQIRSGIIDRKLSTTKPVSVPAKNVPLQNQSTAGRILVGEIYDFNVMHSGTLSGPIVGSGQKTVVALETLEKSVLELRYNYQKKAFTSLDSLFSPVSISGDGDLPQFGSTYSFDNRLRISDISPGTMPPFITGICTPSGVQVTLSGGGNHPTHPITNIYLNPYTNPIRPNDHAWNTKNSNIYASGNSFNVGHGLDIVGRESGVPGSGIQGSFYTQDDGHIRQQTQDIPAGRYSEDYRFLGLKGPLVLHSWGYDTDNRPIPNAIDDEKLIRESGIFLVRSKEGGIDGNISLIPSGTCDPQAVGLKDEFLQDWLQKPKTWPVGPVDLRWDRKRSMWVCPPGHSIVLAQITKDIPEFGQGSGVILQQGESSKLYRQISAPDGKIVQTTGVLKKGCLVDPFGSEGTDYEYNTCKNSGLADYHWVIMSVGEYSCQANNPEDWMPTPGNHIDIITDLTMGTGGLIAIKKRILLPHTFLMKDITNEGGTGGEPPVIIPEGDFCPCEPPTEPPPTEPPTEPPPTPTPNPSPTPTPDPNDKNILLQSCCADFEPNEILLAPYENADLQADDVIAITVEQTNSESEEETGPTCWKVLSINVDPEGRTIVDPANIVDGSPSLCDNGCQGCTKDHPCPTPTPTPTPTPQPPDPCNLIAVIKIKDYIGKAHSKGDFVYAYYDAESDVYIILGSAGIGKNIVTGRWDFTDCVASPGSIVVGCSLMSGVRAGTIIDTKCGSKIHNPLSLTEPPPGCSAFVIAVGYIPFDTNNTGNETCSL